MKKLLLILLCLPMMGFGQKYIVETIKINESEFVNCKNNYLEINKSQTNSFINFYQYSLSDNHPLLYISSESNKENILVNNIDCTDESFRYLKIGNFFDLDYWLLANYSLDGKQSIMLVNKSDNREIYLGSYFLDNIVNNIIFYSNNYFIINYNNGCGAMDGCDYGFSVFKIEDGGLVKVYSTNKFWANDIKWLNNNTLLVESMILLYDWENDEEIGK